MLVVECPECERRTSVETEIHDSSGLAAAELGCGHAVTIEWLRGEEVEEPLYMPSEYYPR